MTQTRILCVDDERNVLRALERIFLDEDYEILTASSGEEGLEMLSGAGEVQVVVSDFRMPGMNGVEFLKEVFKSHPETIRIVLSGYADTAAVVSAINEGKIYKFIPKPWNDDELKMTVAKALETFSIQRRNDQLAEELKRKNQELCELNAHLEQMANQCNCDFMAQHRSLVHAAKILEQLPFGVLSLDDQGVLRQMNREAALMLRLDEKEALGQKLPLALPAPLAALARELSGGEAAHTVQAEGGRLQVQAFRWSEAGDAGVVLTLTKG